MTSLRPTYRVEYRSLGLPVPQQARLQRAPVYRLPKMLFWALLHRLCPLTLQNHHPRRMVLEHRRLRVRFVCLCVCR